MASISEPNLQTSTEIFLRYSWIKSYEINQQNLRSQNSWTEQKVYDQILDICRKVYTS